MIIIIIIITNIIIIIIIIVIIMIIVNVIIIIIIIIFYFITIHPFKGATPSNGEHWRRTFTANIHGEHWRSVSLPASTDPTQRLSGITLAKQS